MSLHWCSRPHIYKLCTLGLQSETALWHCRRDFQEALKERHFAFSVLVHADNTSPLIDFLASSSVLQVSHMPGREAW